MREILQEILGTLLFFVLFFGIGFILNMLIKTTWLPTWIYVIVVLPLGVWHFWNPELSVLAFIGVFTLPFIAGIGGALTSGWAIRALRRGGYKMF
ncbi:YuiB family protein [Cohnella ginsengisoli]|uniref:YuiB family protein n=1 Tax=Cohnella ginsengisoli TaxID=425004 RepID=A0A9X4KER6_9BACL|nr:YuiB family protein [Cohnella ginsengisoli]MDG0790663.1 YuiB family protein [Cohnella ginsengisoli]